MKSIEIFSLLSLLFIMVSCKDDLEDMKEARHTDDGILADNTIVDLSHAYSDETVYWVTAEEFDLDTVAYGMTDGGYFYSAFNFSTAEHGGTHIDAPIHFAKDKNTVDEIPLEKLMGHAIKIDVREKVAGNPDYQISIEDFKNWEQVHDGPIPDGSIVLLETGFSDYYPDKLKYLGTDQRGAEALDQMHFPGLLPEAATWLVENRKINAIGLDTPSIDYGQSKDFKSHIILLSHNVPAFENLTNLNQLPSTNFTVIALPIKIKGGSGGPLRIVAVLSSSD